MGFLMDLFPKILDMSITASVVIIVVIAARLLLKKAPKVISYALWGVVLLRLLCPFSIQSDISLIPEHISSGEVVSEWSEEYVGETWIIEDDSPYYDAAVFNGREPVTDENGTYVVAKYDQLGEPETVGNTVMPVLSVIWLMGVAVMLIYSVVSYIRLRRKLRIAVPVCDNLFIADDIKSPFVVGFIRPRIYLPGNLGESEQEYIIMHEQHHIRRCDHIIKLLSFAALSIHWFNPLVWLAFALSSTDMEMSCDEAVIRKMGENVRADYSASLLTLATGRRVIAGAPLTFGEGDTAGRIKNLAGWKKPVMWVVIAAVIGCAVLAVSLMTDRQQTSFDIRIVVPAGSHERFVYSDEEISPVRNHIIIAAGDNLGDTEVVLDTVEVRQENAYEPTYLTPGMPVRMEAEKGGWFRIGVNIQNPTDEDITVYVHVENIEVRIADDASLSTTGGYELTGFAYESACAWVNYSPDGYNAMVERAKNRDTERRYGNVEHLTPVVMLESKAEFDAFYKEMSAYFAFEQSWDGTGPFSAQAEQYTEDFFAQNTLFIAYLEEPTTSNHHEIEEVRIENGILEIRICRSKPQVSDCAMAGWFMSVAVPKETIADCTGYDAYICAEVDPDNVFPSGELAGQYTYDGGDIGKTATVSLYEDGQFQFTFSPLSSYIGIGNYTIENDRLTLYTHDGMFVYAFDMVDNTLVFDAEASSEWMWYSGVTDGSVFVLLK